METLTSILLGSFGRKSSSRANASGTGPNRPSQELLDKVIHVSLELRDVKTTNKVFTKVIKIPGVLSVSRDGDCQITVTGTVDPETLQNKLRNYRPMIHRVVQSKKHDSDEEGGYVKSKKVNEKFVLDEQFPMGETYSFGMPSPACKWEGSDFDSGDDITIVADNSTTIAPDRRHSNDDWYSFCDFCRNRMPPSNPYGCSADDVIAFLRTQYVSTGLEALVDRLSFSSEAFGVKPENNPFRSLAVTTCLEVARRIAQERECILVFSCNDNLDVDETSFIEAISKELNKREVTPLTYNLLGREKLDKKMLYRSRVGIMVLSNSYVSSRQSLDHLVAVMEHWKTTDLVIIPIYFKVTLSDICGLKGRFEAAFLQLQRSLQEDRVQKWKAAVTEIVSIGGLE